jgi:hypothetical protein
VDIYGIVYRIKVIGANMNINPIAMSMTLHPTAITGGFTKREVDLIANAIKHNFDNDILLGKTQANKVHHLEQIANKVMLDSQNTDPFWINSVNSVASMSRHNYVNLNKVV